MPKSRVGKGLTAQRGPVHGNFEEGARITQAATAIFAAGSSYGSLTAGQKEAIHMIVHKLHRIVTGNSQHKDHWDDIGGYAQLGADACTDHDVVQPKARLRKAKPAAKKVTARRNTNTGDNRVKARPAAKKPARAARPVAKKRAVRAARPARRPAPPAPVNTTAAPTNEAA